MKLNPQVLNNGRVQVAFNEKKLLKLQLTEKKEKLKEQIKALELELKTI